MASKVGKLIKEARTDAGLTQEKLGKKVGLSANDISLAERGEKELTQAQLKKIATACGVTQASLLNAAKETTKSTTKNTTKKSTKTTASTTSVKLTATEKKLVEAYRSADSDTRKAALKVLKGECEDFVTKLSKQDDAWDSLSDVIGDVIGSLLGK